MKHDSFFFTVHNGSTQTHAHVGLITTSVLKARKVWETIGPGDPRYVVVTCPVGSSRVLTTQQDWDDFYKHHESALLMTKDYEDLVEFLLQHVPEHIQNDPRIPKHIKSRICK